jgi:hypothetical protein
MKNNMNKILLYFSIFLMLSSGAAAQNQPAPEAPILQGIKIAFITKQLSLTSEEAQNFGHYTMIFQTKRKACEKVRM